MQGRTLVYWTVYSLDATRCIILHLAATQSLQHARGYSATCLWCAGMVALVALAASQVGLQLTSALPSFSRVAWRLCGPRFARSVSMGYSSATSLRS